MNPPLVVQGRLQRGAEPVEIVISGGRIEAVRPAAAGRNVPAVGGPDCLVSEGFLDIQVNGFAAVDFNRPDLTAAELVRADAGNVAERGHAISSRRDHGARQEHAGDALRHRARPGAGADPAPGNPRHSPGGPVPGAGGRSARRASRRLHPRSGLGSLPAVSGCRARPHSVRRRSRPSGRAPSASSGSCAKPASWSGSVTATPRRRTSTRPWRPGPRFPVTWGTGRTPCCRVTGTTSRSSWPRTP